MYDFLDTVCPECGVEFKKIRIRFEDGSEKYQQAECPVCFNRTAVNPLALAMGI